VTYYNGQKVGEETYWGPDGVKQWSWEHDEAGDSSVWTQYWPNGFKRVESSWRYGGKVAHGVTYHWDRFGGAEAAWNFSDGELIGTAPLPESQSKRAMNPSPADNAEDVSRDVILTWEPGAAAVWHDVYFGADFNDVNDGTDPNILPGRGRRGNNSFNPPGLLESATTCYWRIDEVSSDANVCKGDVWRFAVTDCVVVDDMELYTPGRTSPNSISNEWIDGVTNETGSLVDLGIAPAAPVHGGTQSMMYFYANDFDNGAGYYSEIEREYADPCDWTAHGAKALTLYFYGDPNNDATATERMYVGLEDSSSSYAEVKYGDNGEDMNDLKIAEWQQWNIVLRDFNDGGVDLRNIKKLYIGFGDRIDPIVPGGWGIVYFDDIRLYGAQCIPEYGPDVDLNEDCVIDFADVDIIANEWLHNGNVTADLYEDNKIDFKDFAMLADYWLVEKFWPSHE
jgi:hypothetical protein